MFNVTGGELFMILLVALIVLGPERLPSAARRVGQAMGQLRDLSEGFKREVSQALDDPGEPIVKPATRPRLTALDGGVATAAAAAPDAAASDLDPDADPVAAAAATAAAPSGGADPAPTLAATAPVEPVEPVEPAEGAAAPDPAPTLAATEPTAPVEPAEGAVAPDPASAREPQVAASERTGGEESTGS